MKSCKVEMKRKLTAEHAEVAERKEGILCALRGEYLTRRNDMLRRNWGITGLLVVGLMSAIMVGCRKKEEKPAVGYEALLPGKDVPEGWKQSGEVKVYVGEKLYDSIDGAAVRFFQYAFREQYVAIYSSQLPGKRIQVEVYDMGTPEDAFGVFSCHDNIMCKHTDIGMAATVSEVNTDFCQGRYFVRLQAVGFGQEGAEKPLRAFAEAIARNIGLAGELPDLVKRLPAGYVEGTVLFFHTWETLNERRYIAEENALRLDRKTNGVLAAYASEERSAGEHRVKVERDVTYVIQYPNKNGAQSAKMSYIGLLGKLVEDSQAEGKPADEKLQLIGLVQEPVEIYKLYKGEAEKQRLASSMRVFQNYIFGVWEVTEEAKAESLAKGVETNLMRQ